MFASRWHALPVVICTAWAPVARMRRASFLGLQIALDHRDRQPFPQGTDGRLEKARLAGAGRGHQVDHQDAGCSEMRAVMGRLVVVVAQQALHHLDLPACPPHPHVRTRYMKMVRAAGTAANITHEPVPFLRRRPAVRRGPTAISSPPMRATRQAPQCAHSSRLGRASEVEPQICSAPGPKSPRSRSRRPRTASPPRPGESTPQQVGLDARQRSDPQRDPADIPSPLGRGDGQHLLQHRLQMASSCIGVIERGGDLVEQLPCAAGVPRR